MKGFYILLILLVLFAVLGYLVMKPTDAGLRRSFDQVTNAIEMVDKNLTALEPLLQDLREQKRKVFKLDKEYDYLREQARLLGVRCNAARHNLENMNDAIYKVTVDSLADLKKEADKQLVAIGGFTGKDGFTDKVKALHKFVTEGYPILNKVEALQMRINQIAEDRAEKGNPFSREDLAKIDSFNTECGNIQNLASSALKTIHVNLEQGQAIAETSVNSARKLLPPLEAFIEEQTGGE